MNGELSARPRFSIYRHSSFWGFKCELLFYTVVIRESMKSPSVLRAQSTRSWKNDTMCFQFSSTKADSGGVWIKLRNFLRGIRHSTKKFLFIRESTNRHSLQKARSCALISFFPFFTEPMAKTASSRVCWRALEFPTWEQTSLLRRRAWTKSSWRRCLFRTGCRSHHTSGFTASDGRASRMHAWLKSRRRSVIPHL